MAKNNNYDAQFCGNLAIHQTNTIQDYGFLLVIDKTNLEIIQGSENCIQIFDKEIQNLIGTELSSFLNEENLKHFKIEINKGERSRLPFHFTLINTSQPIALNILAHVKTDFVILEIEKETDAIERTFTDVFQEVRSFISTIEKTSNIKEICEASIREIRRIAGFDGIRMYSFDKNWNGTVIAEEITGGLESYLGQTFPASDVPKQARALYIKNPYRLIPNRLYQSFKLFPVINPILNGFLDLSDCNLRSIASVHLEYMANMGVTASMSIRVMVDGNLWGLISCHHQTAKYLSVENRSIFEWLSMEISYRISSVIMQEQLTCSTALLKKKSLITENIFAKNSIVTGLIDDENQNLLSLFNATGFSVSLDGIVTSKGMVPDSEDLENLMLWIESKSLVNVFSTNNLGEVYEEANEFLAIASGLLVIPINSGTGDFLVCFRPEAVKNIKWGGDPNQAINFEKDGKRYHPRNSFKLWLETVDGQSEDWTEPEIETAESLRNFLFEFSSKQLHK